MTNFEKWKIYTADLPSPDNYITWGWLYMISAALQRRVWMPPNHDRLYPNIYPILVGPPAIGKGAVIRRIYNILTTYKLEDFQKNGHLESKNLTADEKFAFQKIYESELKHATEESEKATNKAADIHKPLLLPNGGDAVTYEGLVQAMARAYRRIDYPEYDEKAGRNIRKIYGHSSMYFCLEDIASLFRKHTESLMIFLTQAYDCSEEYRYKTKTQGEDRIRRLCLSMFGGAVPDFIQTIYDQGLVDSGFSSRVFFVYGTKSRFNKCFRPEMTEEQKSCHKEIVEHVRKLTHLYGKVEIDPEIMQWLDDWVANDAVHPELRANKSDKLIPYYGRKNIHILKVTAAMHFGESTEMRITKEEFERTIAFLHEEEKTMSMALLGGSNNPLAKPSRKIVAFLRINGKKTFTQLLAEFWDQAGGIRQNELEEILMFLETTDQITTCNGECPITKQNTKYYKVKE